MWQQRSSYEQSNVLDVTIQCQFNVATKNVREFSTTYSAPPQQTTNNAFPATCVRRPHTTGTMNQCRLDNITPTKPSYQCEFQAHQRYFGDSVPFESSCGLISEQLSPNVAQHVYSASVGYNSSGTGYFSSCMNDSGYGSPLAQLGHEKNSAFTPCVELSRQTESGSPVFESVKHTSTRSDMFNQSENELRSPMHSGEETCETKIAMRERDVMQRLFSLRYVDSKAADDIEKYYQSQTTVIDLERHNVLCQMAYDKVSSDSINKYYNLKLLSLLECVEGKLSACESKKCKGTKCKTNTDGKSRLLPKHAVKVMQTWYEENLENPYPSREVTLSMASEGGVTVEQIRKWFANKRNRSRNNKLKACDMETDIQ
ncbi:uncharacterized protein LOC128550258 [Mercenaria mercenaria]|uniref:uncharacterized protein LOC128550258 n=1 Tax=Mercenaria mercenaria TaxID=6596 RepID=UPI00234E4774|nr:uncharacterized protein LOC128550258 [Mercenaria mercenaria]